MTEEVVGEPKPLRRLALRSLGLGVLVVCLVTVGSVAYDLIRRTHFDSLDYFSEFTGWQLYTGAALLAAVAVAIGVGAAVLRRRRPLVAGTPRGSQIFWAIVALAVGAFAGAGSNIGTKHLLNFAAHHTAAARAADAENARILKALRGDATHPPRYHRFGGTPTADEAAPMLQGPDLGHDWYQDASPGGRRAGPPGVISSSIVTLTQEKWNGQSWAAKWRVFETVSRYSSAHLAAQTIFMSAHHPTNPTLTGATTVPQSQAALPKYQKVRIAGHAVWLIHFTSPPGAGHAFLAVGRYVIRFGLDPATAPFPAAGPTPTFPTVTLREVARAAIKRAEQAS